MQELRWCAKRNSDFERKGSQIEHADQQPCLAAPWLTITPDADVFHRTETPPTEEELEKRKRLAELDRVERWRHRKIDNIGRRKQLWGPITQAGHWLTDKAFDAARFYENNKAHKKPD